MGHSGAVEGGTSDESDQGKHHESHDIEAEAQTT